MKNHPKGLLAAALSNMGERFGYYIMNAVLVLFLCSTHRLDRINANGVLEEQYSLYAVFSFAYPLFKGLQIFLFRFYRVDKDFHAFRSFRRRLDYLLSAVPSAFGFGVPSTFVPILYHP